MITSIVDLKKSQYQTFRKSWTKNASETSGNEVTVLSINDWWKGNRGLVL